MSSPTTSAVTTIEPLAAADIPLVAAWLSAPQTNAWLTSEWRDRAVDPVVLGLAMRNKKNRFFLARHDGVPCGLVALADLDAIDRTAMVWYLLGNKEVAGKGVTTSALRQLVRLAFEEMGLCSLYGWVIDDNVPSRKVLENAGFRRVGTLRSCVSRGEERRDRLYFDLVPADLARQ